MNSASNLSLTSNCEDSDNKSCSSVKQEYDGEHIVFSQNARFVDRLADAYMGNTLRSDMSFFVEMENLFIPAHANIMAAASEVMERLIYGTGSIVNTDRIVTVPDCSEEQFRLLLRYLYTG